MVFLQPNAVRPNFWTSFYECNLEMFRANARALGKHHWESKYHQWVVNGRGLLFWSWENRKMFLARRQIYALGNAAVVWSSSAAIVWYCVAWVWRTRYGKWEPPESAEVLKLRRHVRFCLIAFACNLLPYLGVERQAFIYHYMPALFYAVLILGMQLQIRFTQRTLDRVVMPAGVLLVSLTFVRYAPWVYGHVLPMETHAIRRLMATWD